MTEADRRYLCLTKQAMAEIESHVDDGTQWPDLIVLAWRFVLGVKTIEAEVTSWDWAIPDEQWKEICRLVGLCAPVEQRQQAMLVWMNKGCSGFNERWMEEEIGKEGLGRVS